VNVLLRLSLLATALLLTSCSGGSEERGRIKITKSQVVGVYGLKTDVGIERLELKPDGSYLQNIEFHSQAVQHTGRWHIDNHLFAGTEIVLEDAALIPQRIPGDDPSTLRFGHLPMHVHDCSGKIGLARNEVAEWYYLRIR
jgi:hypothetical protein